jgi:hypothetical protein
MKVKTVLMMLFVGLTTMGFDCVNDNAFFSINLQGISGTFKIKPGGNFDPADQITIHASDYLDSGFGTIGNVRIYDIRVSTLGVYNGGTINSGTITVNGQPILTLNGARAWSEFNTPQSLVTSTLINREPGGIAALISAVQGRQDIVIRGSCSVSPAPVPDGLYVKVEIFGQVDGQP